MHPTLSKTSTRTPRGYRLARSSSIRPGASRHWPRFSRLHRGGPDAVHAKLTLLENRPVTSVSPAEFSDGEAGLLFWPMSLPLPPRERQPFSRHRTPSASKEPFAGPSDSPGVATRIVLSTPFHPWLPFFADLALWARSPWAPPAATGGAYLDLTSLPDFCNHTKDRAHWANVRTSSEAPFLALLCPVPRRTPGFHERRG
jgi:hypothetical protein